MFQSEGIKSLQLQSLALSEYNIEKHICRKNSTEYNMTSKMKKSIPLAFSIFFKLGFQLINFTVYCSLHILLVLKIMVILKQMI